MKKRTSSATRVQLLTFLFLINASVALGQTYTVNTYDPGDQIGASLHKAPDGTFLVIWESAEQDGDGLGIFANKLNSDGAPVGSEIAINTVTTGDQQLPDAAALTDSRYIVVWPSAGNTDVRGRLLNSNGSPAGGEIVLNALDTDTSPTVVADPLGGFIIAWSDDTNLYTQAFDSSAMPRDDEIIIGAAIVQSPGATYGGICLVALDNGNYLAVWETSERILMRLLDSDGAPAGDTFRVDNTDEEQRRPVVTVETGGVLITWESRASQSTRRTYNRRMNNDGTFVADRHYLGLINLPSSAVIKTPTGFLMAFGGRISNIAAANVLGDDLDANGQRFSTPYRLTEEVPMNSVEVDELEVRYLKNRMALTDDGTVIILFGKNPNNWDVTIRRVPGFRLKPPRGIEACNNDTPLVGEIEVEDAGGTNPVTLSAAGFTFNPNPVMPGNTAIMTGPPSPLGRQDVVIGGNDGTGTDLVNGYFQVVNYDPIIERPAPSEPAAEIAQPLAWLFDNANVPYPSFWDVQLASDPEFNNLLENAVVRESFDPFSETSSSRAGIQEKDLWWVRFGIFQNKVLEAGTEYFWRVRANNACGRSGHWVESSFTTAPDFVIAGEWSEGAGSGYERTLTLEGTPDVAPVVGETTPGTFVISYPGYYYYYFNEVYQIRRSSYAEVVGPQGSQVDSFITMNFEEPLFGGSSETDIEVPLVPAKEDRHFMVLWGGSFEVASRRRRSDGGSIGSQQTLGTSPTRHTFPSAANNDSDEHLVVWADRDGTSRIAGQRLASDGSPTGGVFQVNAGPAVPDRPSVAWSPQKQEFLVVWESFGSGETDTSGWSIQGRRLASDGSHIGGDFQVNAITTDDQRHPEVAPVVGNEDFLVVWQSLSSGQDDNDGWSIQGRRVAAAGPTGADMQLNTFTTGDQKDPDLAIEPKWGGSLVTWQSQNSPGNDNSGWSVQARRLNPSATPQDPEFQVNRMTAFDQFAPKVASHPESNDFMVVWRDSTRILATRIEGEEFSFVDGFESGDTSAWSETIGENPP